MKKNLKFLSGILMASFISNATIDTSNFAKARVSRTVVVNTTSNNINNNSQGEISTRSSEEEISNKNTDLDTTSEDTLTEDETLLNETLNEDEELNEEDEISDDENEETNDEDEEDSDEENQTTNILQILNSDENITVEEITKLCMPMSHSYDFIDELNTTFPDFEPLRILSPIETTLTNYLDVTAKETKTITKYLNEKTAAPSIYSEQNKCNMLLKEIQSVIKEISEEINSELPSTIFSLMPTVIVLKDTYQILFTEYNSIISSNSQNHTSLNILLKDLEENLVSLLKTANKFKSQLPDLIEALNELAESFNSSTNTSNKESSDSDDEDLTENDVLDDEETNDETSEEISDEETEDEIAEEISDEKIDNEIIEEDNNEIIEEETTNEDTEEEVDPNSVIVYFGDQGQELIYDEKSKKYYQLDPENPDSDNLIEYNGEVTQMTLAEYLDMDLFFDNEGNELIYDLDTNSYFLYKPETDEFIVYEGEIVKKKIKDLFELN